MIASILRLVSWSGVLLAVAASPLAAQDPRPMSIVDLLSIPKLDEPRLSPDGRRLLFVRTDADWEANRDVSHIWRVDIGSGEPVQLTNGETGESSPRWSPDGTRIAFLARRHGGDSTQVWLLRNDGGEAVQLTSHQTAVSSIAWAPDGSAVYFIAADEMTPEEAAQDRAWGDVYALDEDWRPRHLWRASVPDGSTTRITGGEFSVWEYSLSLDGRRIALVRAPDVLINSRDETEVWLVDADGGAPAQVTRNRVAEQGVELSPDKGRVLFTSRSNAAFEPYYPNRIFIVPATGGEATMLMSELPHQVMDAVWSGDGAAILFTAGVGVRSDLYRYDLQSGTVTALSAGDHSVTAWSYQASTGVSVLGLSTSTDAGDFRLLEPSATSPARITRIYDDLDRRFLLPRQQRVEWKGADGVIVDGILEYPVGYVAGRRYPLAVHTHGGPRSADKFGFAPWYAYPQVLTGMGWAVLRPNYRGSTGYGDEFERDMVGHYYNNSHLDVMAGVDHLITSGIANEDRMVKFGWSAGGHMTNKIITFTDRFRAASSGAGGANFLSFYAQTDSRNHRDAWFGGPPWSEDSPYDVIWETSPVKDAWKVTTPTIFQVGAEDERVPPPQAVEMFRALKANGVPTHLYIAPGEPHVYRELRHRLFKINVELDWFERHARARDYRWERAPGETEREGPDAQSQR